jgi:hypothetical protein
MDDGVLHTGLVEIGAPDDLEAVALEGGRHVIRVVKRIGKGGSLEVGAIANDEGDAFLSLGIRMDHAAENQHRSKKEQRAHVPVPNVIALANEISSDTYRAQEYGGGRVDLNVAQRAVAAELDIPVDAVTPATVDRMQAACPVTEPLASTKRTAKT